MPAARAVVRISILVVSFLVSVDTLRADPPSAADYIGKWELLIHGTNSTFRSGALLVEEADGGLRGELVWRWGSVAVIEKPGAISVSDEGDLVIQRGQPIILRRRGNVIEGYQDQKNGTRFNVTGLPGKEDVELTGSWRLEGDDGETTGRLMLADWGFGRVDAHAFDGDGEPVRVKDVKVDGRKIRLTFVAPDDFGDLRDYPFAAEIRGDRIVGALELPDGSGTLGVTGARKRSWGRPIGLLAQDSTAGWRPRDGSRRFGWTVTDGVLTNAPPDVDIVSEAEFDDFKLTLEYRVNRDGKHRSNSGVYLRGRYEVQILDDWNEDPAKRIARPHGNGAVYSRIRPEKNASGAPGTWQKYEITLIGRFLTVVLNGETLIDNQELRGITGGALLPFESDPGPLMLQGDHGKVEYRNIVVTPALPEVPSLP